MKILFASLGVIALSLFAQGQVRPTPLPVEPFETKIEDFSSQPGTLLRRESIRLGEFAGIAMDRVTVTDLMTKTAVSGLRFSKLAPAAAVRRDTAYLDADEVDGLIRSVDLLSTVAFSTTPDLHTELFYQSRGGFSVRAVYVNRRWTGSVDFGPPDTRVPIEAPDIESLRALLRKAKEGIK